MTARRLNSALVWFRRDLRDFDHAALYHALKSAQTVHCAFIFDREILDALPGAEDRRVEFIWESVIELAGSLAARGGSLHVLHAFARDAIPQLAFELGVDAVFANHDYEPAACARDAHVDLRLAERQVAFHTFKDQVIFERDEVLSQTGKPFSVFTPYKNAWLRTLTPFDVKAYPVDAYSSAFARSPSRIPSEMPSLESMGFRRTNLKQLGVRAGMSGGAGLLADFKERIEGYRDVRDFPARKGPSYLSVHLRFGTVSIRELAALAHLRSIEPGGEGAATWLSELIWRDFYAQILWHHPRVANTAFKTEYADLVFPSDGGNITSRGAKRGRATRLSTPQCGN